MTIFTRKELTSTYTPNEREAVCEKLRAGGIDYQVKVINRQRWGFFEGFALGARDFRQPLDLSCEYRIYVDRADYEQAQFVLRQS